MMEGKKAMGMWDIGESSAWKGAYLAYLDACIRSHEAVDIYLGEDVMRHCRLMYRNGDWLRLRSRDCHALISIQSIRAVVSERKAKDVRSERLPQSGTASLLADVRAQYLYDFTKNARRGLVKGNP